MSSLRPTAIAYRVGSADAEGAVATVAVGWTQMLGDSVSMSTCPPY
jgi:hypothetical protein